MCTSNDTHRASSPPSATQLILWRSPPHRSSSRPFHELTQPPGWRPESLTGRGRHSTQKHNSHLSLSHSHSLWQEEGRRKKKRGRRWRGEERRRRRWLEKLPPPSFFRPPTVSSESRRREMAVAWLGQKPALLINFLRKNYAKALLFLTNYHSPTQL